jgi:hypothetical protein
MSDLITSLDESLADAGQDVVLRRILDGANVDVTVRASVRRDSTVQDLFGTLPQGEDAVIISPTQIDAAEWPAGETGGVPKVNDTLIIQGRPRKVKVVKPIVIGDELVRIEMVAAG